MSDFLGMNFLLLLLCLARRLMAGRISRRLQYALWLLIPGYLLAARFIPFQSMTDIVITVSPGLAYQMLKLEVSIIHAMNAAKAMTVEALNAGGIAIRAEWFYILTAFRYDIAVALGIVFCIYNMGFMVLCIRRRRFYKKDLKTGMKIYILDFPQTPFLLGQNVYVHPDMTQNDEFLCHAVCHEHSHYKQGDFFWVPLRFLFLIYYWFDPIVWMAVMRMGQDSELSCDERVLSVLGEESRGAYGASLIMLLQKNQKKRIFDIMTMMGGKKKQLMERITAISGKQKRSIVATGIVAVGVILVVCYVLFSGFHGARAGTDADAVFLWDGTGVDQEDIETVTLYRFWEDVSYPSVEITEEVLNGQAVPLTEPGRYMVIVTTKNHKSIEISDRGKDEAAYSKGLLPSQVINLGGDNR